ncbi:MAG: hypothetical protein JXB23_00565 [Candidatus Aminicenantes bacterium]|nr:hypothetical protein [Candidatus Aminicenantes bacterium]
MKSAIAAFIGIFSIFSLFVPGFGQKPDPANAPSRIAFTSLHKSLLVPGWGQIAEKRYIEGLVFLSAEIFALYKVFSNNHKGNQYYDQYKEAGSVDDAVKFRELTERYDTQRNRYLLVAAGIWAVNLIDIYFIVKGKKREENNLRLRVESGTKNLALTLSYRF